MDAALRLLAGFDTPDGQRDVAAQRLAQQLVHRQGDQRSLGTLGRSAPPFGRYIAPSAKTKSARYAPDRPASVLPVSHAFGLSGATKRGGRAALPGKIRVVLKGAFTRTNHVAYAGRGAPCAR